ncbi:MAG: SurA N-terminal domain-containing protein [Gallionellaceae bacterium]|nr:SurA N-terminal domain-containing protein [Gallionellaceae bacterium]
MLPFAFWGVDSYNKVSNSASLATVDGDKITQEEFEQALRQQQGRMREMLGSNYDPTMFETPAMKRSVLENLVSQRLLIAQARAAGLTVSNKQLVQTIASIDAFQKNGQFDKQLYETVLRNQNMSPETFQMRVVQELSTRQLTDAYMQNGYASTAVADNLVRLNEQQRVVALAHITPDGFMAQVKVDEPSIQSYYETNQKEFQTSEQVRVEYVTLSADAMQSQVSVDDAEISKYYEEHQNEFGTQEQRQAAHILISTSAQASDTDKQAAKAKAEQILQQLKQAPAKFAELAKQYSQDTGSAANGGDLGLFGRGMMVKSFDDAAFKLKVGEISGVVQSDFGFHIIKVLAIKPAQIQSLAEARNGITQRLKLQKANDRFSELAEKFSNMAYEQSDTLKPAAELVKMPIQQSPWLSKGSMAMPPWTANALQTVFSDDVIKNKRNSTAVEISPNTLLVARLLEHKPASIRPLAEVAEMIRQKLLRRQALELTLKQGKTLLAQLQRGEKAGVAWKPAVTVTREKHAELDNDLMRQVFQVNATKLPAYVGKEDAQGGYTLARVEAIKDIESVEDTHRAKYLQQLRQSTGDEMFQSYLADTKKRADIKVSVFNTDEKK